MAQQATYSDTQWKYNTAGLHSQGRIKQRINTTDEEVMKHLNELGIWVLMNFKASK
ncbi:hypothetical protein SDC9_11395 [bioreactor metagenome]|uniref:Uncharacterized protein n=1 Tax=bioreactor metagenome TaxID=1076179 RepID=A0A644TJ41_9ZZZZ|nr:hypothetical protein [Negativicutes bacterium]